MNILQAIIVDLDNGKILRQVSQIIIFYSLTFALIHIDLQLSVITDS